LFPSEDGSQEVKVISRAKKRNRIFFIPQSKENI